MRVEANLCPYCLHEYDDVGGCPCGERAEGEEREAEAAQVNKKLARDWAKEYLPAGWHRYLWRMLKDNDGIIAWQGRTLDVNCMAVVSCPPMDGTALSSVFLLITNPSTSIHRMSRRKEVRSPPKGQRRR